MKRVYDAFIEFTQQEKMEDVGLRQRKRRELLCKKNRSPAFVYTLYIKNTLQTQRKKNRRPSPHDFALWGEIQRIS